MSKAGGAPGGWALEVLSHTATSVPRGSSAYASMADGSYVIPSEATDIVLALTSLWPQKEDLPMRTDPVNPLELLPYRVYLAKGADGKWRGLLYAYEYAANAVVTINETSGSNRLGIWIVDGVLHWNSWSYRHGVGYEGTNLCINELTIQYR